MKPSSNPPTFLEPRGALALLCVAASLGLSLLPISLWAPGPQASLGAYIDPGMGVMLLQALAAAFFGALFYLKSVRKALGRIFSKKKELTEGADKAVPSAEK